MLSKIVLICSLAAALPSTFNDNNLVLTENGIVAGVDTRIMREYLGIPYAAPPVGNLRWRPPQPAKPWRGVRDASQFAPHCAQPAGVFIGSPSTSEDCLYLNVYAPNKHSDLNGLPVMVWMHGGGFTTGYGDGYNPTDLVTKGNVIVVTLNYRLGALGFLSHPALTAESLHRGSGNYGIMDQQEALRWVKRNIRSFGGDPGRVTVFGESSGGASVHAQLASPLAGGLFDQAIIQSGAYELSTPDVATAESAGVDFASTAGCADQSASCLRSLSVETILSTGLSQPQPVVDGYVLPQSVATALATGRINKVPVLQGSNQNEFTYFYAQIYDLSGAPLTAENYPATVAAYVGSAADAVMQEYPLSKYSSAGEAFSTLITDGFFAYPAFKSSLQISERAPVFAYEFNDQQAPQRFLPPISIPYGAYHASDVQYLFSFQSAIPADLNREQEALASAMQQYWTAFARTGEPRASGEPPWPRFHAGFEPMLSLDTPRIDIEAEFALKHHCEFWRSLGF